MLNVVIGTGWQDPFAEFEFCERESGLGSPVGSSGYDIQPAVV